MATKLNKIRNEIFNYYDNLNGKMPMNNYLEKISKKYGIPLNVITGIHNEYATGTFKQSTYSSPSKINNTISNSATKQKNGFVFGFGFK